MAINNSSSRFCIPEGCYHWYTIYIPARLAVQIDFSQGIVGLPGYRQRWYGILQGDSNAWEFFMAFGTKASFGYPAYHEENNYSEAFIEWHAKSCLVIKAAEHHLGPFVGVYPSKSLHSESCSEEHMF